MTMTRAEQVSAAILLLSADQFTQTGLPDVSELNAAMPEGSAPVSAAERTEIWEQMVAAKAAAELANEPEGGDDDDEPEQPEAEAEEAPETVTVLVTGSQVNPVRLMVNNRVVAVLTVGQPFKNFPVKFLEALSNTDAKFVELSE